MKTTQGKQKKNKVLTTEKPLQDYQDEDEIRERSTQEKLKGES